MRAVDKREMDWWDTLSEEEQIKLGKTMFVFMRYVSSVSSNVVEINEHYLLQANDKGNVYFNLVRHHPQLQHRLLQAAGIGTNQNHQWIKPPKQKKKKKTNSKLFNFYLEMYPHFNDDEIAFVIANTSKEEITTMLEDAGIEKKKIKEYFK